MRSTILILAFVFLSAAAEDPSNRLAAMQEKSTQEQRVYALAWLAKADLGTLPTIKGSYSDLRPSEQQAVNAINAINAPIAEANRLLEESRKAKDIAKAELGDHAIRMLRASDELTKALAARDAWRAAHQTKARHELDGPEK